MPIPVWTPGQILVASDVNAWLVPVAAYKASDETVTSSTAMQNDNDLVVAVAANAVYVFDCYLYFTGATTGGDLKWGWTVPSGTVLRYVALHNEGSSTALNNSATTYFTTDIGFGACAGAAVPEALHMHGTCSVSATPGNLQLQWAQNTSNATATTVRAQSHLILQRIA